jgi:hypothetical protein
MPWVSGGRVGAACRTKAGQVLSPGEYSPPCHSARPYFSRSVMDTGTPPTVSQRKNENHKLLTGPAHRELAYRMGYVLRSRNRNPN